MNETIPIPLDDLYSFLHTAIGYALGRRSYITGVVCDQVRMYWKYLNPDMRATITRNLARDIEYYDRSGSLVGMDMDDKGWRSLLKWCQSQLVSEATPAP